MLKHFESSDKMESWVCYPTKHTRILPYAPGVRFIGIEITYHEHTLLIDQYGAELHNLGGVFTNTANYWAINVMLWKWVVSIIPNIQTRDARYVY